MRKLLLPLIGLLLCSPATGEEMSFVTTLSQPVASFARVEVQNPDHAAHALQVNFCNTNVSTGNMNLNGAVRAAYLKLENSGSLGGNVPVYQLKTLNLGSNKSFEGGNVWAHEANPAALAVTGTFYGGDMNYLVAELPALKIEDSSGVKADIKRGGPTGQTLEWSAQYTCDYKSDSSSDDDTMGSWKKVTAGYPIIATSLADTCDNNIGSRFDGVNNDETSDSQTECLDLYIDNAWGGTAANKLIVLEAVEDQSVNGLCQGAGGCSECQFDNSMPSGNAFDYDPDYYGVKLMPTITDYSSRIVWYTSIEAQNRGYFNSDSNGTGVGVGACRTYDSPARVYYYGGFFKVQKWTREKNTSSGESTIECKKADAYSSYLLKSK